MKRLRVNATDLRSGRWVPLWITLSIADDDDGQYVERGVYAGISADADEVNENDFLWFSPGQVDRPDRTCWAEVVGDTYCIRGGEFGPPVRRLS